MTFSNGSLSSGIGRLRVSSSLSSLSDFGLKINDIVLPKTGVLGEPIGGTDKLSLEERVFGALAEAKAWTSRVAMHMDLPTRDRFFRQLDRLHELDEWLGDEQPVALSSYQGFVRFMLRYGGQSKPALALSSRGFLLAIWEVSGDRLTVEFKSENLVEWVISRKRDGQVERAAGSTVLTRLEANLQPYEPEVWLRRG